MFNKKIKFCINVAEITTNGIQQAKEVLIDDYEDFLELPAYDFTEEQYQEHLRKRRKQELEKPRWKER